MSGCPFKEPPSRGARRTDADANQRRTSDVVKADAKLARGSFGQKILSGALRAMQQNPVSYDSGRHLLKAVLGNDLHFRLDPLKSANISEPGCGPLRPVRIRSLNRCDC